MRRLFCCGALAAALSGCMSSEVVLLEGARQGGAVEVQRQGHTQLLVEAGQGLLLDDGRRFTRAPDWLRPPYRAALQAQPAPPRRFQLMLDTDGGLGAPSLAVYEQALAVIRERAPASVLVIGHTDTLGDAAANQQLGLRRARQVARMLEAESLEILRLQVTSHGEANLLVHTPDATAEPRNRRVEISVQ